MLFQNVHCLALRVTILISVNPEMRFFWVDRCAYVIDEPFQLVNQIEHIYLKLELVVKISCYVLEMEF